MIEYEPTDGGFLIKNIKLNEGLKIRIISGGLSIVLVATGFVLGKLDSKNNSFKSTNATIVSDDESMFGLGKLDSKNNSFPSTNSTVVSDNSEDFIKQYLSDYIEKREELENEIASLLEKKERLKNVETFNMEDLVVMENANVDNETNLYILCASGSGGICYEYHNNFKAWYRMHQGTDNHFDLCSNYIHFNECQPLFNYLTDEEIEALTINGGKITTLELDQILIRIRSEYQKQLSENNSLLQLSNN